MRICVQTPVFKTVLAVLIVFGTSFGGHADDNIESLGGERLVIHFKAGQAALGSEDRNRLELLMEKYKLGPEDKIVVIGYTDSQGKKKENNQLSRLRAEAVKKVLARRKNVDVDRIITIGRGETNPVSDNRTRQGRAENRRAEVYLTQVIGSRAKYDRMNPNRTAVEQLVKDARENLRRQRVTQALQLLQEAGDQGGDRFSDWHAVLGIAGYYARMPLEKVIGHLATALRMDPHHSEAREYYGRVEAMQNVTKGLVTSSMGKTRNDPIVLSTDTQSHEYLRLFDMQPLSHEFLSIGSIEVWQCRDAQGNLTNYYFNHANVHDWLFTREEAGNS